MNNDSTWTSNFKQQTELMIKVASRLLLNCRRLCTEAESSLFNLWAVLFQQLTPAQSLIKTIKSDRRDLWSSFGWGSVRLWLWLKSYRTVPVHLWVLCLCRWNNLSLTNSPHYANLDFHGLLLCTGDPGWSFCAFILSSVSKTFSLNAITQLNDSVEEGFWLSVSFDGKLWAGIVYVPNVRKTS